MALVDIPNLLSLQPATATNALPGVPVSVGIVPVRRDSLASYELIRLLGQSWSDGLGPSLGPYDPRFIRTGSWRWRTSRFGSNSPCGRRAIRGLS